MGMLLSKFIARIMILFSFLFQKICNSIYTLLFHCYEVISYFDFYHVSYRYQFVHLEKKIRSKDQIFNYMHTYLRINY